MPIRLAIVDGHTLTRYGLRELISQQPDIEIVAESGSAAAARADVWSTRPDVVTVDVRLPDGNGLQLAREFRDRDADLGIVLLTSQEEDDVLFRALETGVSAFVAKSAQPATGGGAATAERWPLDSRDRDDHVHQPVHGQDVRGQAV